MATVAFSMPKAERNDESVNKQHVTNPGAGTYSVDFTASIHKPPSWSMGASKRKDMSNKEGVPAPGCYEAKSRMGEMPAFVMGGKLSLGGSMDVGTKYVPGPGTYTP